MSPWIGMLICATPTIAIWSWYGWQHLQARRRNTETTAK